MTAELSLVAVLITTCATAIIGIISQIQHSRCTHIKCCGDIVSCDREVDNSIEPTVDLNEISTLGNERNNLIQ